MPEPYLLIDFPGGRQGAVLEADALDEDKADLFAGASVRSWEDGSAYAGAATFGPADEAVVTELPQYIVVEWSDGREGAVLPADYIDIDNAERFAGTTATAYESGEPWSES